MHYSNTSTLELGATGAPSSLPLPQSSRSVISIPSAWFSMCDVSLSYLLWVYTMYMCIVYTCTSFTEMIAGDNVAFLCELMDEIGRKDLTDEVKSYIERTEGESGMYMYKYMCAILMDLQ